MLRNCCGFCLALACLAGPLWAQEPSPAPPLKAQAGPLTFNVVVTDKAGHPVSGLQESDFRLFDQKKPAQIQDFRAFDTATDHADPPQIILVIDAVNASFTGVSLARAQIENFLHSSQDLPAIFSMAYLTDTGVDPLGQPTTDPNALAQELHGRQGELRDLRRSAGFYGAVERMQLSMRDLEGMTERATKIPGRKLMIWISPGWPVFDNPNVMLTAKDERGIFQTVVAMSDAMRRAQMSVYLVDPLGTWDAGSMHSFLWQSFLKPVTKPDQANPGNLALQVLATHSGGRALWGSNDVAGELTRCAQDAKAWYRISFDPQRGKEGPTWHDVAVRVDKPGLEVRTLNGYYAQP